MKKKTSKGSKKKGKKKKKKVMRTRIKSSLITNKNMVEFIEKRIKKSIGKEELIYYLIRL